MTQHAISFQQHLVSVTWHSARYLHMCSADAILLMQSKQLTISEQNTSLPCRLPSRSGAIVFRHAYSVTVEYAQCRPSDRLSPPVSFGIALKARVTSDESLVTCSSVALVCYRHGGPALLLLWQRRRLSHESFVRNGGSGRTTRQPRSRDTR